MQFTKETLWLKDFYLSKIHMEIRRDQEGLIRVGLREDHSSHLYLPSHHNESGITPKKFCADDQEELRNPKAADQPM
jgi:hypothetical protein